MPVFDFNHTPEKGTAPECTYTTFLSGEPEATAEKPILILDNQKKQDQAFLARTNHISWFDFLRYGDG